MNPIEVFAVPTLTHGRVLVRAAHVAAQRGLLVGFHGYVENAVIQMERLEAIPGSGAWTLVSVQGLHRFYRGRTEEVVASWMTRQDREDAITDNLAYVEAALEQVPHDRSTRVVYVGFSQGAAMALRAGVLGPHHATAIVAVGGDVPPDLLADSSLIFPPVFFARGGGDAWMTAPKFDHDVGVMEARGIAVTPHVYDAAHEWTSELSTAIGEFLNRLP